MALQRASDRDLSGIGKRTLRPEGWYAWVIEKSPEIKRSGGTQAMGEIQIRQLKDPEDADSKTGQSMTLRVMTPDIEDLDKFKAVLLEKGQAKESNVDDVVAERLRMADEGLVKLGYALHGYDHFSPVPKWDRDARCYYDSDGSVVSKTERDEAFKRANDEAYDAGVDALEGNTEVVRFTFFANINQAQTIQWRA
jgi:hypothetical protein